MALPASTAGNAGAGCGRARTSSDEEDSTIREGDAGGKGICRRNHVAADATDEHNVPGPVPGGRAGNGDRIREIQSNPRWHGRGMDACVAQYLLSRGFKAPDSQLC